MSKFAKVRDLVMGLEADFEKFYDKNNQAAGTRVRKGMQDLKVLAQEIRKEVQDMKNKAATKKPAAKKPAAKKDAGKAKKK
jgi:hypothetical protein